MPNPKETKPRRGLDDMSAEEQERLYGDGASIFSDTIEEEEEVEDQAGQETEEDTEGVEDDGHDPNADPDPENDDDFGTSEADDDTEDDTEDGDSTAPDLSGIPDEYIEDGKIFGKYDSVAEALKGAKNAQQLLRRQGKLSDSPALGQPDSQEDAFSNDDFSSVQENRPDALSREEIATVNMGVSNQVATEFAKKLYESGEEMPKTTADWLRLQNVDSDLFDEMSSRWKEIESDYTNEIVEKKRVSAEIPKYNEKTLNASREKLDKSWKLGKQTDAFYKDLIATHGGNPKTGQLPNPDYFTLVNGRRVLRPGALETFVATERQSDIAKAMKSGRDKTMDGRRRTAGKPDKPLGAAKGKKRTLTRGLPTPEEFLRKDFMDKVGYEQYQKISAKIEKLSPTERAKYRKKPSFR